MKGQLTFDESMNITEENIFSEKENRIPMCDPCYYCQCNSCMNNAESRTVSPDEVPYDWNPCFRCDECSIFDDKCEKNMEIESCSKYVIDNFHARAKRLKFRVLNGGTQ